MTSTDGKISVISYLCCLAQLKHEFAINTSGLCIIRATKTKNKSQSTLFRFVPITGSPNEFHIQTYTGHYVSVPVYINPHLFAFAKPNDHEMHTVFQVSFVKNSKNEFSLKQNGMQIFTSTYGDVKLDILNEYGRSNERFTQVKAYNSETKLPAEVKQNQWLSFTLRTYSGAQIYTTQQGKTALRASKSKLPNDAKTIFRLRFLGNIVEIKTEDKRRLIASETLGIISAHQMKSSRLSRWKVKFKSSHSDQIILKAANKNTLCLVEPSNKDDVDFIANKRIRDERKSSIIKLTPAK